MKTALVVTLIFVAATSMLGGVQNARRMSVTRNLAELGGAIVGIAMTLWCFYLAYWVSVR
jgi:hypothetical protein